MERAQIVVIPILGVIKAGKPIFVPKNIENYKYIDIKRTDKDRSSYSWINSNSMINARAHDRDLAYIKTIRHRHGNIAIVLANGYGDTLKRALKAKNSIIFRQ